MYYYQRLCHLPRENYMNGKIGGIIIFLQLEYYWSNEVLNHYNLVFLTRKCNTTRKNWFWHKSSVAQTKRMMNWNISIADRGESDVAYQCSTPEKLLHIFNDRKDSILKLQEKHCVLYLFNDYKVSCILRDISFFIHLMIMRCLILQETLFSLSI